MRRSIGFFVLLLIAIGFFLHMNGRALALFQAALVLNLATCGWYLGDAFSSKEKRRHPVIQAVVCSLLLLFNAVMFMGVYTRYAQSKTPIVALSQSLPAVSWTDFDGGKHAFSELSGHVAVLHFWASWCGPCREEFPELLAFAKAHPRITVLAFAVKDDEEKARAFLKRMGAGVEAKSPPNLLFGWDPGGEVTDHFLIPGFPSSIVVDPKGIMRRKYVMLVKWTSAEAWSYLSQWPEAR